MRNERKNRNGITIAVPVLEIPGRRGGIVPTPIYIRSDASVDKEYLYLRNGQRVIWYSATGEFTIRFPEKSPFRDGKREFHVTPESPALSGPVKCDYLPFYYQVTNGELVADPHIIIVP